jgi:hypothetical protein
LKVKGFFKYRTFRNRRVRRVRQEGVRHRSSYLFTASRNHVVRLPNIQCLFVFS